MSLEERREGFLSIEDALNQKRDRIRSDYKEYVNSGKATLLRLLNFDQEYVSAKGMYVYDSKGREYLDFLGGYGSLNFGHNPPSIYKAMERVRELPNILQASIPKITAACARNLETITPGALKRSFFCNSGTEAVEASLKLSRKATGERGIIYTEGSYHGKTFGALSVTGRKKYREPFQPLLSDTHQIPYGDIEALKRILEEREAAAFILEPIQGEGGIILPPSGYLHEAMTLCRERGVLLILDEIQTGFGRTGTLFACEQEEVEPDIMVLSKSLGGGVMPIGVCITTDSIWKRAYGHVDDALLHTSTFGENTLASAAAIAAMELLLERDFIKEVEKKGEYFIEKLKELQREYPLVKEVRGRGLMIGIEFIEPKKGLLDTISRGQISKLSYAYLASLMAGELFKKHRIITAYTLNNPNVIRLAPPLIVTYEELDRVVEAFHDVFSYNRGLHSIAISGARTAVRSFFKD